MAHGHPPYAAYMEALRLPAASFFPLGASLAGSAVPSHGSFGPMAHGRPPYAAYMESLRLRAVSCLPTGGALRIAYLNIIPKTWGCCNMFWDREGNLKMSLRFPAGSFVRERTGYMIYPVPVNVLFTFSFLICKMDHSLPSSVSDHIVEHIIHIIFVGFLDYTFLYRFVQ